MAGDAMAGEALEFVQMRVPATHLVIGAATRRPGRTADVLVEGVVRAERPVFRARAILAGLDEGEVLHLAGELCGRYAGEVQSRGHRIKFDMGHDAIPDGVFGVLLAFQASFGPVWIHYALGRLTLRARAVDCTPKECADHLRQALRMAEVRRHVRVVALQGDELAGWRELQSWRAADELQSDGGVLNARA